MSAEIPKPRKIRRRKAPTLREAIEQTTRAAEKPKKRRLSLKKLPLKKFSRLGSGGRFLGRFFAPIWRLLKPIRKLLSWLAPRYLLNAWRELRQVIWPSRGETWRLTLAVFIFAIVFGLLVAGVDKVIDDIFKKLVLR